MAAAAIRMTSNTPNATAVEPPPCSSSKKFDPEVEGPETPAIDKALALCALAATGANAMPAAARNATILFIPLLPVMRSMGTRQSRRKKVTPKPDYRFRRKQAIFSSDA
jgi:hypothetical protein